MSVGGVSPDNGQVYGPIAQVTGDVISAEPPVHGELLSWGKIRCFSGLIARQDARCRHPVR